jgi:hypothetical protein
MFEPDATSRVRPGLRGRIVLAVTKDIMKVSLQRYVLSFVIFISYVLLLLLTDGHLFVIALGGLLALGPLAFYVSVLKPRGMVWGYNSEQESFNLSSSGIFPIAVARLHLIIFPSSDSLLVLATLVVCVTFLWQLLLRYLLEIPSPLFARLLFAAYLLQGLAYVSAIALLRRILVRAYGS